jgi:hypothetical protein
MALTARAVDYAVKEMRKGNLWGVVISC